jgi:hypothetical protein
MMQQHNPGAGAPSPKNALRLRQSAAKVVKLYDPRTWKEKGLWWTLGLLLLTGAVLMVLTGIYWSRSPSMFDVEQNALEKADGDQAKLVPGYVTTATAMRIGETLLDKPGGYITNDVLPPGLYLDNIKNWEFGALTELRDLVRALRNDFARSQTQSTEDKDLQLGEPQFHFNSDSWILPSTESAYKEGLGYLENYLNRLADNKQFDGQFYSRADNLAAYLAVVEKRLGSYAQRLAASAGEMRFNIDLAGDPNATKSTPTPSQTEVKTNWWELDDIFFESRGYCWALLHTLKATQVDFRKVLVDKNAEVSLRQIVRALENTQKPIWSPLILNGTGFGPMANHSLVMASYISRANAAIIDLRNLLEQG